jgi:DNA polymerase I-like protein with 3'-5' exonuclease and polymerase domains
MNILTLDVETTHKEKLGGGTTALPHFGNRLVSVGWKWLLNQDVNYEFFYHKDSDYNYDANVAQKIQNDLDEADVLVGQNIKFDITWLRACGFKYDGHLYDTMVAEYLRAKARKWSLSLESLAKRYNVKQKEVDLIAPYLKDKKTFYDIPADIVEEYGKADVIATEQVAVKQLEAFGLTFEELYETDIKTVL